MTSLSHDYVLLLLLVGSFAILDFFVGFACSVELTKELCSSFRFHFISVSLINNQCWKNEPNKVYVERNTKRDAKEKNK